MVKTPATGKRKAAPAPAEDDDAAAAVDAMGNVSKITPVPVPDEFSPPMAKRLRSAKKPRKPGRSESAEPITVLPVAAVGDENGENGDSMPNNNDNDNNNSDNDNDTTKNDQMQQDDRGDDDDDQGDENDDQEEGEEEVEVEDEPMPAASNDDDQQPATEDPLTAEGITNEIMEEIVADDIANEIMEEMAADDITNQAMEEGVAAATVDPREPEAKVAANTEHEPLEPTFDTTAAAAATTVDATTTAIATNGKHISPIAKLRMPSQHTPGKVSVGQNDELTPTIMLHHQRLRNLSQEDHASKAPDAPPVVNRVTTERPHLQVVHDEIDEIMVIPPTDDTSTARQQWWQTTLGQFQDILTTMVLKVPPSQQQQQQQPDNHDGVEVEHATPSAKPWTWSMWFLTFFTLQLVILTCSMQHLYPSMDALVVSSIRQYKVEAPEIVENVTYEQLPNEVVTVTRTKPPPPLDPELDLGQTLDTLVHQLAAVDGSFADLTNLQSTLMGRLQTIRPAIGQHQASLHAWEMSLQDAEHELDLLLSQAREDIPQFVHRASVALAAMTAPYTATVPLISITSVPMWTVAPPVKMECPTRLVVPATGEDALVTLVQMEHAERTLATMVTESVEAVKHNIRGTAQAWIRQYIGSIAKQHAHIVVEDDTAMVPTVEPPEVLQTGLSEADVMSTIMDTLDLDLADKTGVIDYASLYAGAKIIRHGPRATSPSLVDTLPLFNKLLRATKLRFYGYGPEAALTPTKPWNALGQCWSFSDMTKNKKRKWKNAHRTDNTNGKYATLSIQLALPIPIGSIVLEHTLPTTGQHHQNDDAQSSRSAPKDVRVFGYMDPEASGRPFPLGEFTFDSTAQPLQTFVITEMNNVKLQSVTLALDSNHGNDYTCLYRFRVHAAKQK